jgi:O-antigen/teichoic acid export membrane protein
MRELWIRIAQTSGAKIYALIAGVMIVSITARQLGPLGRGELAVVVTWVSAFATLVHLSLGQVALHRAAEQRGPDWLRTSLPVLLLWCAVASLFAWVTATLLYLLTAGRLFGGVDPVVLVVGFLSLPLLIWEQYSSAVLMGLNKLKVANTYQVIGRSVSLVCVVCSMLLIGPFVVLVVVSNAIGQVITTFGGLKAMREHFHWQFAPQILSDHLRSGLRLHFNAIGTFLFASCDILILNHYAGTLETGFYQLGTQLLAVLLVVPQAVSTVLYAKVSEVGPDAAWPMQHRALFQTMALMLLVIALAALAAEQVILLVAGPSFLPSVDVFRWQLLSALGMSVSAIMAPQWIGRGLFRLASAVTLCVGLLNVTLTLWLVPEHGMLGAAWSGAITYTIAIVGNGAFAVWCGVQARAASRKGFGQ